MRWSLASCRVLGEATLCWGLQTSSKSSQFPGHNNWLLTGPCCGPTSSHWIQEGEVHFKAILSPSLLLTVFWKRFLFLLQLLEGSQSLGSEPLLLLLHLPGVTATFQGTSPFQRQRTAESLCDLGGKADCQKERQKVWGFDFLLGWKGCGISCVKVYPSFLSWSQLVSVTLRSPPREVPWELNGLHWPQIWGSVVIPGTIPWLGGNVCSKHSRDHIK